MTAYRRYRLKGSCYFFTAALAERRSRLLTENIQELRTAFREIKQAHPFTLEAVVMWRVVFIRWIGVERVVLKSEGFWRMIVESVRGAYSTN